MNALVVFEAAGRHESLLKAAEELNVTAGAVSRQVKHLEEALDVPLFVRSNRKVTLTPDGRAYWTSVNQLLQQLRAETENLVRRKATPRLHVRCSMLFMRSWLLPRFAAFSAANPGLDVTFTIARSAQAMGPDVDCAIRLGREPWPELRCEHLMSAPIVPICSPAYLEKAGPIRSVADLARHTLLHSMVHPDYWTNWLGPMAEKVLGSAACVNLEGDGLSYQAALEGLGVALGRLCLVGEELMSKRLVVPFHSPLNSSEAYYLVTHPQAPPAPEFEAFRSWIIGEAQHSTRLVAAVLREPMLSGARREESSAPAGLDAAIRASEAAAAAPAG